MLHPPLEILAFKPRISTFQNPELNQKGQNASPKETLCAEESEVSVSQHLSFGQRQIMHPRNGWLACSTGSCETLKGLVNFNYINVCIYLLWRLCASNLHSSRKAVLIGCFGRVEVCFSLDWYGFDRSSIACAAPQIWPQTCPVWEKGFTSPDKWTMLLDMSRCYVAAGLSYFSFLRNSIHFCMFQCMWGNPLMSHSSYYKGYDLTCQSPKTLSYKNRQWIRQGSFMSFHLPPLSCFYVQRGARCECSGGASLSDRKGLPNSSDTKKYAGNSSKQRWWVER